MSQITGKKQNIIETRDGATGDYAFTDKYPVSVSGQRKTVLHKSGLLITAFYTKPAKIGLAYSKDNGETWEVRPDIFAGFAIPGMQNAFNPALATDRDGVVHMAFRAFGPDTAPYAFIWYAKSKDGVEWSKPMLLPPVNGQNFYHGYPVIGSGPKNEVYIAFDFTGDLYLARSLDGGKQWAPLKQITQYGNEDTRPSMVVDKDGVIYLAYSTYGYLYCLKGQGQGENWQRRKIFGSERVGGHYPSIALDNKQKPVIAYRAFSGGLGPDVYRGIHIHRQVNDWTNAWNEYVIDTVYTTTMDAHTPSLAITREGMAQLTYIRSIEQNSVPWQKWAKDIVFSQSKNWVDWTAFQQITESHDGQFGPQVWPNLYWQPNAPAKGGFLVVWDGKDEKAELPSQPWFARSFCTPDFKV